MTMRNISQARAQLSALVALAESGEEVIIARAGKPIAKLTAIDKPKKPRRLGFLKGKIWIAPDFDVFDEELEEMFYGNPIEPA